MITVFTYEQRITVVEPSPKHAQLLGWSGTVKRFKFSDAGGFVEMDKPLPSALRVFDKSDSSGRDNWIVLYPEECEERMCQP